MEKTNSELNIQNSQPQKVHQENSNSNKSNKEEAKEPPQNQIPFPNNEPSSSNNIQNSELTPNNKIQDTSKNIQNNPQGEINIQQNLEKFDEAQNIQQIDNINQISSQEAQNSQQNMNEQYIQQYQIPNHQEIPINNYLYLYPQITDEQNQYVPQQQNQENENRNIYDYITDMNLYGIAFQNGNNPRLAISTLEKRFDNKIEIIELVDNQLKKIHQQQIGFPCTKILWTPNKNKNSLLAFSNDCMNIYDYSEEKQSLIFQAKLNNLKSKYCGPLTSFDWNMVNDSLLATASLDTTCTIWDLNKLSIKTQLIAHDKEVFDIKFGKEENTFISGGADGSVRLFDLRNLNHSTIIYEAKENSVINKLAWNLQISNLIAALCLDKNAIYIFDSRMNTNVSLEELSLHKEPVTGIVWAPDDPFQLCSISEDCNVIISCVSNGQTQNNNISYTAPCPINNVDWCRTFPEWIGINFRNRVQLLRK